MEVLKTFLLAFLGGAGGVALINAIHDRWKWKAERKAAKEDKEEEKTDKIGELTKTIEEMRTQQDEMSAQMNALREAMKCVLLDRIIYLAQSYIADGEVDFDDRKRLRDMHSSYHNGLEGNGDADALMKGVDALPLKKTK
ncbi:MAG: hypothetical protein IJG87_06420 [Ruminococcus sp.]|nr:hypothetical protein [Ruminococcus sp.]